MNNKTKNILIWVVTGVSVLLVIGVIKKASKKTGPLLASQSTGNSTGAVCVLDDNNWDDMGGYRYVCPDKSVEYYDTYGTLKARGNDRTGAFAYV